MNPMSVRVLAADGVRPSAVQRSAGMPQTACNFRRAAELPRVRRSAIKMATQRPGSLRTRRVATVTATLAPGVYSSSHSVNPRVRDRDSLRHRTRVSISLVAQGRNREHPAYRERTEKRRREEQRPSKLQVGRRSGTLSSQARKPIPLDTPQSTRCHANHMAGPGDCVRRSRECAMRHVLCKSGVASQQRAPDRRRRTDITGAAFQPVIVQVTDLSSPPNPVIAAPIVFQTTVLRPGGTSSGNGGGDLNPGNPAMPVILQVSQSSTITDATGSANIVPSSGGFSPAIGGGRRDHRRNRRISDDPLQVFPQPGGTSLGSRLPTFLRRPVLFETRSEERTLEKR